MKNELDRFLHYLEVERGFSPGTIAAYRLDLYGSLFPFLHRKGKHDIKEVIKEDIRALIPR